MRFAVRPADRCAVNAAIELAAGLGSAARLWRELTEGIADRYGIEPILVAASGTHGPELKYRKGGRTLVSLSPGEGGFTALVVLGAEETQRAFELELGSRARRILEDARQYHDGRWLFVPVTSRRDVRDVTSLVALKRRPLAVREPAPALKDPAPAA
jgi:hypothetical protein